MATQTTSDDEARAGVNTTKAAGQAGGARDGAPASRIVRIDVAGPLVVAATILATAALAVPHEAWLPWRAGAAIGASWDIAPGKVVDVIATLQVALARRLWPSDIVVGAIAVAA